MARKVLIVEDESNIAELINLYLKKEGYETMIAPDGGKALELYRLFRPDLVLLDIMLPKLDGLSVLRQMRSEGVQTPVLMLTARTTVPDKVAGLNAGADDYLTKPFGTDELLARVRTAIRHTRTATGNSEIAQQGTYTFSPGFIVADYVELVLGLCHAVAYAYFCEKIFRQQ